MSNASKNAKSLFSVSNLLILIFSASSGILIFKESEESTERYFFHLTGFPRTICVSSDWSCRTSDTIKPVIESCRSVL